MTDLQTEVLGGVLGGLGTIGSFTAYVLIWRGWVAPTAKRYAALNAVGGLLGAAGSLVYGAWPAVISNLVWAAIGAASLISAWRRGWNTRRSAARWSLEMPPVEHEAALAGHEAEISSHEAAFTNHRSAPAGYEAAAPLTAAEQAMFEAITQPLPVITAEMLEGTTAERATH